MSKHEFSELCLRAAAWTFVAAFSVAVWTVIGRGVWLLLGGGR